MSSKLRNLTEQEFSDFKDHVENCTDEQKNNLKKNIYQLDNGDVVINSNRRDFLKQLGLFGLVLSGIVLKTEQAHAIFNVLMMKKRGGLSQIYVDDVFSTYLYTGTDAIQSINNGIDLLTKGGLVWIKCRSNNPEHMMFDTARGINNYLEPNSTQTQNYRVGVLTDALTAFNTNGFTLGPNASWINVNTGTYKFASWTFRKATNFFDIVTYTGTGANRSVSHNLGSVPGMIIIKRLDGNFSWAVYHTSIGNTKVLQFDTAAAATDATSFNNTSPTSSVFTVGTAGAVNANGGSYIAYLFAHDTSSTGLIQCGTFTSTVSALSVNLGWEPQYILCKRSSGIDNWEIIDSLRGFQVDRTSATVDLKVNTAAAESGYGIFGPTSTGFTHTNGTAGDTYVYMAIRRPNKPPTLGTQVFSIADQSLNGAGTANSSSGFPVDFLMSKQLASDVTPYTTCRLTNNYLQTAVSAIEGAYTYGFDQMQGVYAAGWTNAQTLSFAFKRAPGFFDMVNYVGVGTSTTITHGLGVAPELVIIKGRSTGTAWTVWHSALPATQYLVLNSNAAKATDATQWNSTSPTASVFSIGTAPQTNSGSYTFIAHLFATTAGVSKVGSYTGDGISGKVIACGFSSSARFIMIKRTDSTGEWFVWNSVRGIVAGNDPYININSAGAEVSSNDSIDTDSSGFIVNQVAASNINVNAATYIFLAIA